MTHSLTERARDVLRAEAAPSIPMSRLYQTLAAQTDGAIGSYRQLRERLRRHPHLFEVLEPAGLPWDTTSWPDTARREYEDALQQVGALVEPRVALRAATPPSAPPDEPESASTTVLRRLDMTLVRLWEETADDAEERTTILEAMARADALRPILARVAEIRPPSDAGTPGPVRSSSGGR